MPPVTIICPDIPDYLRNGMSQPKIAGVFLEKAFYESIKHQKLDSPGRPIRVDIDDDLMNALLKACDKTTSTPVLLGEYVNAVVKNMKSSVNAPVDAQRSVYQQAFYDGIAPEIAAGKIVLAEGATGIGKGRVLARIAKEQVEAGNGPVAVAGPTVAVLKQLIEEWIKSGYPTDRVSCVLGKQQFVDTEALRALVTDEIEVAQVLGSEKIDIILQWIDNGCPVIEGNANTAAIQAIAPNISCLDADIQAIVPELEPFAALYLLSDNTSVMDPGYDAYYQMRISARMNSSVIFCTHAMITYDLIAQRQDRTRILPEYHTLLIDEAHQFERNMSSVSTYTVSIHSLKNLLKKTEAGTKAARNACLKLCGAVMKDSCKITAEESSNRVFYPSSFSQTCDKKYWLSKNEQKMFTSIVALRDSLSTMMRNTKKKDARLDFFRITLDQVATTAKGAFSGFPVLINNTPVRKWPVIITGKPSVEKDLSFLWDQLRGAVLVSATLSVPSGQVVGHDRAHIFNLLHIPAHRAATPVPVVPSWITDTPVLHLPDPNDASLCYPVQDDFLDRPEDFDDVKHWWRQSVADKILSGPAVSALGGTLVLLCSYDDVEGIGEQLKETLGDRVLLKNRISSIGKQKNIFKEMARNGERPIWLAVGGAWTGLDLRDELVSDDTPEDDTILTDLVIPRLNFSENQSLSHMLRWKKRRSVGFTEAAFTFRQGLGRLIRRPGVKDRRIWFLDNRINLDKSRYDVFKNVLAGYRKGGI